MERSLVLLKPDAVQRALCGRVIDRLERKGLRLVAARLLQVSTQLAEAHYQEHSTKPFFGDLVSYITSGPVLAMVWEGYRAIQEIRNLVGPTNPAEAPPGTIRGDYAMSVRANVIHASTDMVAAKREIALFFSEDELVDYKRAVDSWVFIEV
ncbi:MAG: nucleoside-diphosphate kinase [Bacillota bacterium]